MIICMHTIFFDFVRVLIEYYSPFVVSILFCFFGLSFEWLKIDCPD